jgi:hypothetical protein
VKSFRCLEACNLVTATAGDVCHFKSSAVGCNARQFYKKIMNPSKTSMPDSALKRKLFHMVMPPAISWGTPFSTVIKLWLDDSVSIISKGNIFFF